MNVHIVLFLVSLFYGILFSWAGEIMPQYLSAESLVWMRVTFAALIFQVIGLIYYSKNKVDWKTDWKTFAICGFFGTSANMYLFFKGLEITHPINAAVLMLLAPLFVAVFDHIRLNRTPTVVFSIALFIAAIGCIQLIGEKGISFQSETIMGDIWVGVNAIFYAIYLVKVKSLTQKYPAFVINRWTFSFGWLYITPIGLLPFIGTDFNVIPSAIALKIGYILVVMSFLVYFMNAYAIQKSGPTLTGVYIYLQPLLASVIAVFLGTDELSLKKAILIILVLVSVFIATKNSPSQLRVIANSGEKN